MENKKAAEILQERFLEGYILGLYTGNCLTLKFHSDEVEAIKMAIQALSEKHD